MESFEKTPDPKVPEEKPQDPKKEVFTLNDNEDPDKEKMELEERRKASEEADRMAADELLARMKGEKDEGLEEEGVKESKKKEGTQEVKEIDKDLFERYLYSIKSFENDLLFKKPPNDRITEKLREDIYRMQKENPNLIHVEHYLNEGREYNRLSEKMRELDNERARLVDKNGPEARETEQYKRISQEINEISLQREDSSYKLNETRTGLPNFVAERIEKEIKGDTVMVEEYERYKKALENKDMETVAEMRRENPELGNVEKYQYFGSKYYELSGKIRKIINEFDACVKTFGKESYEAKKVKDDWDKLYVEQSNIGKKLENLRSKLPDFIVKEQEEIVREG